MSKFKPVDTNSVFAVSGGGRGITAECVVQIAHHFRCKFILLGRTSLSGEEPEWARGCFEEAELKKKFAAHLTAQGEKPTPVKVQKGLDALQARREISKTVRRVEEEGGQAVYLSVDITDSQTLKQALDKAQKITGAVTGIIHGAGNLADKLIENKTLADFENVFTTKVRGLINLLECLPPNKLSELVLFSSVAGFFGNAGQADYSMANEVLNKTALLVQKQQPECRVISLNWGPWDGGMVTPALREFYARRGIHVIPVEDGTQRLVDALETDTPGSTLVVVGPPLPEPERALPTAPQTFQLRRRLDPKANPFLVDHRIGGNPVLPAICVIDWVANACEQLFPGYTMYTSINNRVFKGLVFETDEVNDYTLELKEIEREGNDKLVFEATIWSVNEKGKRLYHYGARCDLRRKLPQPPIVEGIKIPQTSVLNGVDLYRDGTLFHGPAFQGVRRVLSVERESMLVECYLPAVSEKTQGQFPVQNFNPYAVDVQLQCMLIWARHFYQAGSLPLSIQHVEQYRTIPFDKVYYAAMQVQTSSEMGLIANVTAFDEHGVVYTRINGAEVTISQRLNSLFVPAELAGTTGATN
ncbi:MAG: SDR family NAD(P)-dependent oxidoreductase [Chloroflexi bacterium]|uniref:SDR family NAD(P)-dependent oxidoreductase n=1 Tax=Candidatus Chlorohelix allophototropha TaxID=3003348 RepID=A0A8T7M6G9_9CHLR|nr:SDR family NAD(P)-dependent oxidoreductase [Chloroflexota bacterium]WJW69576.1 SDR family NAD(P)-dependent oxidoreductase [Chloroflexota bacterium L227-S17]